MSTVRICVRTGLVLCTLTAAAALLPSAAGAAGKTTWICKPGQADDLCAGTIDGTTNPATGAAVRAARLHAAEEPAGRLLLPVPDPERAAGPNSNLEKDPPIRRVVVQQARMFSTVCNVYAPMYRQVTNNGDQSSYNDSVEKAYRSAKSAFEDYLHKYNDGRGFILHRPLAGRRPHRAADRRGDRHRTRRLRKRFVGAIAPGANIPVPIGKAVGGMYAHVPACTKVGQYGCVIAFSTYNAVPGPNAEFSRLDTGYWIYPHPRYSADSYEVMCTDPARLDGGDGTLLPLVDYDYLTGVPANGETAAPWSSQPDYYKVRCRRKDGSHWLNLSKVGLPGDNRIDLGALVASGSNYHVPEVNLAEGNLLRIAQMQTDSFEAEQAHISRLKDRLASLRNRVAKQKRHRKALHRKAQRLREKAHKADAAKRRHHARHKLRRIRHRSKAAHERIKTLRGRIAKVEHRLG